MHRIVGKDNKSILVVNPDGSTNTKLTGSNVEQSGIVRTPDDKSFYKLTTLQKLTIPTYDGGNQPVHPSVKFLATPFAGYHWWMAFTPYTNSNSQVENPSVVASNDGITWVVPAGITNPIEPKPDGAAYNRDTELVYDKDNNQLRVYWGNSLGEGYYRTISASLVVGERVAVTGGPFGSGQATIVRRSATDWEAWGQLVGWSSELREINDRFARFTSTDGITWAMQPPAATNLAGEMWHVGVTADETGYHFLAAVHARDRAHAAANNLFYGYSTDGKYISFDPSPMMTVGEDTWNNRQIYHSCIVPHVNGKQRVYISASGTAGWGVGCFDVSLNNPRKLVSSIVRPRPQRVEKTLFLNYEVRSTTTVMYSTTGPGGATTHLPEFNEYENKVLLIRNTHDQDVRLQFYTNIRGVNNWDLLWEGAGVMLQAITVRPVDTFFYVSKDHLKSLGTILPGGIAVGVKAVSTLPTTGIITVSLVAW